MNNILPWNQGIFADLNSIINQTLGQIETPKPTEEHALYSTPEGWALRVDLPGYEKSEITINLDDNALKLTADNDARGAVDLSFALGDEVETAAIKAKLENGVLELLLPKKEEVEPARKTIEIQ